MINIRDFNYDLPADRIANHPLRNRDESKLLVYKGGEIRHEMFKKLPYELPSNTLLFFNDTKVIPARIHFQKDTGAEIQIFLLTPVKPSNLMAEVMATTRRCTWSCTIGNLKRWKDDQILTKEENGISLSAKLVDRNVGLVEFQWTTGKNFAEVIPEVGVTPLPPYIKREASAEDIDRYQTVYSHYEGAVAAPTAGLHFTDNILAELGNRGIEKDFLTLHVSAGTFQPVKTENALEHVMHQEQVVVTRKSVERILKGDKFIVAVGTTSMRTLESLYWFGVKLLEESDAEFNVTQHDPYQKRELPLREQSLKAILNYMSKHGITVITGRTSIFIHPGYEFRICDGIITNFHQPGSTLILLVAALIGKDWERVYQEALQRDYRFLSYGDSSLLIPKK